MIAADGAGGLPGRLELLGDGKLCLRHVQRQAAAGRLGALDAGAEPGQRVGGRALGLRPLRRCRLLDLLRPLHGRTAGNVGRGHEVGAAVALQAAAHGALHLPGQLGHLGPAAFEPAAHDVFAVEAAPVGKVQRAFFGRSRPSTWASLPPAAAPRTCQVLRSAVVPSGRRTVSEPPCSRPMRSLRCAPLAAMARSRSTPQMVCRSPLSFSRVAK
jgi:hypothetical protein